MVPNDKIKKVVKNIPKRVKTSDSMHCAEILKQVQYTSNGGDSMHCAETVSYTHLTLPTNAEV